MAYIDPFELMQNLEAELDNCMDYYHPQRKLINAIRESIVPTSITDEKKLADSLERERARNE